MKAVEQQKVGSVTAPRALKLKGACAYLGGLSEATVRRLIARGLLKPIRVLRHILLAVDELDRFIASGGS